MAIPAEVRERAVRLVPEHRDEHASEWAAIRLIAEKIGCNAEPLRTWVRQAQRDGGEREGHDHRDSGPGSARTGSSASRTRFCARPARILPRRSSTAGPGHDRLHRRAPMRLRGRADLQRSADRPVDLP